MKFIVDNNVGRLAVWLRALGYDTLFINPIDDGVLVKIALDEERVVLTKDVGVMERRLITSGQVKALFIHTTRWTEQLKEVVDALGLQSSGKFTRCLNCNTTLTLCSAEKAAPHVPPDILAEQSQFFHCSQCDRYFWQGSHWERMLRVIDSAIEGKRKADA